MKVSVLHDEHGRIISISNTNDLKTTGSKFIEVGIAPGPGQSLIETDLEEEHQKRDLLDLHKEYQVDVKTSKLMKRHIL